MSDSGNDKSVVERLLDASVFAPLGFALKRNETVRDLAAAGRKQIAFTRSLGRAAIKGFSRGGSQAAPDPVAEPATATEPAEHLEPTSAVEVAEPTESAQALSDVAVEGYDSLTAREIVELLTGSNAAQARWIADQELAGKNRVTVLRAATKVTG